MPRLSGTGIRGRARRWRFTGLGQGALALTVLAAVAVSVWATTHRGAQKPLPPADPERPGVVLASAKIDLSDPYLFTWRGRHYLYVSTALGSPPTMHVPAMEAERNKTWGPVTDALPTLPSWAKPRSLEGKVWSPEVVRVGKRFLMYFAPALRHGPESNTHCLGVATASSPLGPFVPKPGPPIVCQLTLGGDIDPQIFVDPHGPRGPRHPYYLIWKSDNNTAPGAGRDTAWAAPLRNNGLVLGGRAVRIFNVRQAWEQPFLEAPQMAKAPNGSYWLLFSTGAGYWQPGSAIGIAQCKGPLGPCRDTRTSPLIGSNAQGRGPGEETVFVANNKDVWILYGPWHGGPSAPYRPVEAAHLGWNRHGRPVLLAPGGGPLAYR
ncbi:MAG: family 43 glycosylhydrolase [Acidimicrobiaceae bacterium]|nr:family 43 glycosylhydrolase [Acidimicrobiaceae bacterium]